MIVSQSKYTGTIANMVSACAVYNSRPFLMRTANDYSTVKSILTYESTSTVWVNVFKKIPFTNNLGSACSTIVNDTNIILNNLKNFDDSQLEYLASKNFSLQNCNSLALAMKSDGVFYDDAATTTYAVLCRAGGISNNLFIAAQSTFANRTSVCKSYGNNTQPFCIKDEGRKQELSKIRNLLNLNHAIWANLRKVFSFILCPYTGCTCQTHTVIGTTPGYLQCDDNTSPYLNSSIFTSFDSCPYMNVHLWPSTTSDSFDDAPDNYVDPNVCQLTGSRPMVDEVMFYKRMTAESVTVGVIKTVNNIKTLLRCAAQCASFGWTCKSVTFDKATGLCSLLGDGSGDYQVNG